MKVLQINTVCGNGSVGRITVDISHALEQAGEECLIAYGRRSAPPGVEAWRFGTNKDISGESMVLPLENRPAGSLRGSGPMTRM